MTSRKVVFAGTVLAVLLGGARLQMAVADTTPLYGTNSADTIVYGDILEYTWDKIGDCEGWYCYNRGAGICIFEYSAGSPYRGDPRTPATYLWSGTGYHVLYGDIAQPTSDYIYPADLFAGDSDLVSCGSGYYVSIASSLPDCECGTSGTASFDEQLKIHGDTGSISAGNPDHIWGWDNYDQLYGNGGNDYVYGGDDGDDIWGDDGNDYLYGGYSPGEGCGTSYEIIDGGDGSDHIYGCDSDNAHDDELYGGDDADAIYAYDGDDYVDGGDGGDVLFGHDGDNDQLWGRAGVDCLSDDDIAVCNCGGDAGDTEDCPSSTDCPVSQNYCIAW